MIQLISLSVVTVCGIATIGFLVSAIQDWKRAERAWRVAEQNWRVAEQNWRRAEAAHRRTEAIRRNGGGSG